MARNGAAGGWRPGGASINLGGKCCRVGTHSPSSSCFCWCVVMSCCIELSGHRICSSLTLDHLSKQKSEHKNCSTT
uniref:Uncharacterized protein n=1 Tax=Kalanchoe fedtschenkoi TaxID=63787 RepID=A0A7N0ZVD8_KALFE